MKMMQTINRIVLCGGVVAMIALAINATASEQTAPPTGEEAERQQEGNAWDEAGKEVREAAGSVADATKETAGTAWETLRTESADLWQQTKTGSRELFDTVGEKSKEAWQVTREGSREIWEKGKARIHQATAPEPPAPPEAAPPAPPVAPSQPELSAPAQSQ